MATAVRMPVLGLTMEEGTISAWLKAVGDQVQRDEPLVLIENDKAVVEAPSPVAGRIARIIVKPGETVPIKTVIAEIEEDGPTVAAVHAPAIPGDATSIPVSHRPTLPRAANIADSSYRGIRFSSPRARRRARELGVDLDRVLGTGPNGRIVEDDVVAESRRTDSPATPLARRIARVEGIELGRLAGTGPGGRITRSDVVAALDQGQDRVTEAEPATITPLSRIRQLTATRMTEAARAIPPVTLFLDADLGEADRFRHQIAPELARLGVPKLPWDALIAKAAGLALAEHPALNSRWHDGKGIERLAGIHVGVAVNLDPEGLVVPVLRDADRRSLRDLASDLLDLIDRARSGRLRIGEASGSTFTITNLGAYRITAFTPIINPPEAAILGVGRIAERPAVIAGHLDPRILATLSLTFDHRIVDGAPAAAFLGRLAELLERPYALLGI